jgi:hypothetical protein
VGHELAKLGADMAHPALERAATLSAMLVRQEFEVVDCANVQDCRESPLLLVFVGNPCVDRLKRCAV